MYIHFFAFLGKIIQIVAYDDHSDSQQARPQSTADHTVQPQVEVSSTESGPAVNSGEGPDETEQSSPSEEEWRSGEQDNMESGLAAGCHDIDNFDDNNIDAYSSGDDCDVNSLSHSRVDATGKPSFHHQASFGLLRSA